MKFLLNENHCYSCAAHTKHENKNEVKSNFDSCLPAYGVRAHANVLDESLHLHGVR